MTERENIMFKIKKLLALADTTRNDSPEQAASAAAKVQEMLFNHNLSMSEVKGLQDIETEPYEQSDYILNGANQRTVTWKSILYHRIAKVNFCQSFRTRGTVKVQIIGRRHNIEAVEYLYLYLSGEIERLAQESVRLNGIISSKPTYLKNFCTGASMAVCETLRRQQEISRQQSQQSTALVVRTDQELKQALAKFFPGVYLTSSRTSLRTDSGAYQAGRTAGTSISIRQGIGGSQRQIQ